MVLGAIFKLFLVGGVLSAGALYYCFSESFTDQSPPDLPDQYFGKGLPLEKLKTVPKDDPAITKYTIKVPDSTLIDLKRRLNSTRYVEPLEDVEFQYGFNGKYLKEVVEYWRTKYDWRKHELVLNKYNQYITQIEGINVHFIHHKPTIEKGSKVRVIPLLMIHGWPGSIVEFQKILPMLTTPTKDRNYVFEVVCPSIPGYGFSEAPHQKGFTAYSAARMFSKLMTRLGFKRYYVQGGDWGSLIAITMAKQYPDKMIGVHTNMAPSPLHKTLFNWIKYAIGYYFPSLYTVPEEYQKIYPFTKVYYFLLQETGYAHIQATKPDTVGAALEDSPAGLAAYILEKFSTWTDPSNIGLKDGGLTQRYNLDELLTNVMVYWITNTIGSSCRLYKETMAQLSVYENVPNLVPTGIAAFPNEILYASKAFSAHRTRNVVRYTRMPKGGHFAAMEQPELLSADIYSFVADVEAQEKELNKKK